MQVQVIRKFHDATSVFLAGAIPPRGQSIIYRVLSTVLAAIAAKLNTVSTCMELCLRADLSTNLSAILYIFHAALWKVTVGGEREV